MRRMIHTLKSQYVLALVVHNTGPRGDRSEDIYYPSQESILAALATM